MSSMTSEFICKPCNRMFKDANSFEMHVAKSNAHKQKPKSTASQTQGNYHVQMNSQQGSLSSNLLNTAPHIQRPMTSSGTSSGQSRAPLVSHGIPTSSRYTTNANAALQSLPAKTQERAQRRQKHQKVPSASPTAESPAETHPCTSCGRIFSAALHLSQHYSTFEGNCSYGFGIDAGPPTTTQTSKKGPFYPCTQCTNVSRRFSTPELLEHHRLEYHVQSFNCSYGQCQSRFHTSEELASHMLEAHMQPQMLASSLANLSIRQESSVRIGGARAVYQQAESMLTCLCCGRTHPNEKTMRLHWSFYQGRVSADYQRRQNNFWSVLEDTPETRALLEHLVVDKKLLTSGRGYLFPKADDDSTSKKGKCSKCHAKYSPETEKTPCRYHPGKRAKTVDPTTGQVNSGPWSCCDLTNPPLPCITADTHDFVEKVSTKSYAIIPTPPRDPTNPKRFAVSIDCEMGITSTNDSELIQFSMVDYFSGQTLIDLLVHPRRPIEMKHYNTKWSGVTRQMMNNAIAARWCLDGWQAARERFLEYVDAETILLGHSLGNDLKVLRLTHERVVDSAIVIPQVPGWKHSLKELSSELLGAKVQAAGKKGHDCVEDALAARELVVWCVENPKLLEERKEVALEKKKMDEMEKERNKKEKWEKQEKEKQEQEQEKDQAEKEEEEYEESVVGENIPELVTA